MTVTSWRVAVTRDEDSSGPLSEALRIEGFVSELCPVFVERPVADRSRLIDAAGQLESFDWAIFASVRAVRALVQARQAPWPAQLRTAAVGARTAAALTEAGAREVIVAPEAGAEPLWKALINADDWRQRRVLVPQVKGGRTELVDGLHAAGAQVTAIEAYAMEPRPLSDIAAAWRSIAPDSAVIASPSVGTRLVEAIGIESLQELASLVAMGQTTAHALAALGVTATVPDSAGFPAVASHLRQRWALRTAAESTGRG